LLVSINFTEEAICSPDNRAHVRVYRRRRDCRRIPKSKTVTERKNAANDAENNHINGV